jgi:hypothetical protein
MSSEPMIAATSANRCPRAPDHLAVEFQHTTKHAVRRRMLGTEIDREIAKGGFLHG